MPMLRKVTTRELRELYDHMRRDFPASERLPYFIMRESCMHGRLKALYLIDDMGEICGYALCVTPKAPYYHIQYIAVFPEHRGKGYGGLFLELLDKRFAGRKVILEVEDPAKAANEVDGDLRRRRIGFYERAGLRMLDNMIFNLFGTPMLCMTNDPEPLEDPRELWMECYLLATGNRWMLRLIDPVVYKPDLGARRSEETVFTEKIPLGRYRHFKGGEYRVLYLANHSETQEVMVVYQALYGDRGIWVRPAAMWTEMVHRDNVIGPRFTYLGKDGEDE